MINFEWYRTFKMVYQAGTFTGAAEALYMSQPGVRKQIAALEAHVGRRLFERLPKKVVPTEYAHLLYGQVIGPLEILEKVEKNYRRHAPGVTPVLSLGSPHEFFRQVVAEKLPQLNIHVSVTLNLAASLLQAVEAGELDAAVSVINPSRFDVIQEPFFLEAFWVVGSPNISTGAFSQVFSTDDDKQIEDWLTQQTWYVYSGNLSLVRRFWKNNFRKRPSISPRYIIPDLSIIKKCLIGSPEPAVSLLPDYLVEGPVRYGALKLVWKGKLPTTNQLYFTISKKTAYPKEAQALQSLLQRKS